MSDPFRPSPNPSSSDLMYGASTFDYCRMSWTCIPIGLVGMYCSYKRICCVVGGVYPIIWCHLRCPMHRVNVWWHPVPAYGSAQIKKAHIFTPLVSVVGFTLSRVRVRGKGITLHPQEMLHFVHLSFTLTLMFTLYPLSWTGAKPDCAGVNHFLQYHCGRKFMSSNFIAKCISDRL